MNIQKNVSVQENILFSTQSCIHGIIISFGSFADSTFSFISSELKNFEHIIFPHMNSEVS